MSWKPLIPTCTSASMYEGLLSSLEETVRSMVSGKDVAVAFSGGLDSGVLAILCKRYARSVRLYTVGLEESYDVRESRGMSRALGMDWTHIPMDEGSLLDGIKDMVAVTGTTDPIVLSFEVPLMYVLSSAEEDIIVTGQGADEVFLGYSKYVGLDDDDLEDQLTEDMRKLYGVTRIHEAKMAEHSGKTVLCPFLDSRVMSEVSRIPLDELKPYGELRKVPLRHVAESLGCPELASKPKKAAQYGSGSMNTIRRLAKSRSQTVGCFIIGLVDGVHRE